MAQPPKKKRQKLPKGLLERNDRDVMEHVFGKRGMRAIDEAVGEKPDQEKDEKSDIDIGINP